MCIFHPTRFFVHFIYACVHVMCPSIYFCIYKYIHRSICRSTYLSIHLSACPSIYPFIPSIWPSIHPSIYPSIYLASCLRVCVYSLTVGYSVLIVCVCFFPNLATYITMIEVYDSSRPLFCPLSAESFGSL